MFRFKCHPTSGKPFEVVALSRAIAAWENAPNQPKNARRNISKLSEATMGDLVDLAWYAAEWLPNQNEQSGQTGLDLPEWRKQVDIEMKPYDVEDEEVGPTSEAL